MAKDTGLGGDGKIEVRLTPQQFALVHDLMHSNLNIPASICGLFLETQAVLEGVKSRVKG